MDAIRDLIQNSKKIVLKIGSNVLSGDDGAVNKERLRRVVEQIVGLIRQGKQVLIVSSGAGICGVAAINKWSRRGDINYKQALCAVGQVELMNAYKEFFGQHDIHVGQMLLTREDFGDHIRTLNIRNTLFTLVDEGVVPVINENDSVSVEEIKLGDNDTLGALAANLWNADLLIILSDIDGVFDRNPQNDENAAFIGEVYDTDALLAAIDSSGTSDFGTGGIVTKIQAARRVNEYGIPLLLLNGKRKDILTGAAAGNARGTIFFSGRR
jgi:glutamate 5-kinase